MIATIRKKIKAIGFPSEVLHNVATCPRGQEVPLDAGASCGMVQRIGKEKGKGGRRPKRIWLRHYFLRRPPFPLVRPAVRTIPFGQTAVTKGDGIGGCHRADGNGGTDWPNGISGSQGQGGDVARNVSTGFRKPLPIEKTEKNAIFLFY